MSDIIDLKLNEENELCFELVIEGYTTSDDDSKPLMRFQIEESSKSGMSYTFPVNKMSDGSLQVILPRMEHFINENKKYVGNLEVVVGGQYFVPQTIDLNFIKPLKVEAKNVSINKQPIKEDSRPTKVSARVSAPVKTIKKKKSLDDYTPDEQLLIRKEFARRKAALIEQHKKSTAHNSNKSDDSVLEIDDSWFDQ